MAVNYVKGQILSSTLERDGIDISIANANVGINTTTPTVALDVNGNIQANNFNITGTSGNITGANVVSAVTFTATGNVDANNFSAIANITGRNLNISANVAAGNVLTDHLLYANGTPWDLQEPAGSNTEIQFNNNSQFGASNNFTFDTVANLLVVNATANIANINVAGDVIAVGSITSGNLTIANTAILATTANGNINLQPAGTGLVSIDTTTGLILPVGNTAQRPGYPTYVDTPLATIRYNTALFLVEYFDGLTWTEVGGVGNLTITDQQIWGDGTSSFTLDQETNQTSILVSINGINQIPGSAYTVFGNVITFTESPLDGDQIDIRFLATPTTRSRIFNGNGTTYVDTTDSSTILFNVNGSNVMVMSPTGATVTGNIVSNNITAGQSLTLPGYTVAQAANIAGPSTGQVIYVSNGDTGNPCLAVYSGGAWKRVSLGANISAT